jgi:hypothetical protein
VLLDDDVRPGTDFVVRLTVGKAGGAQTKVGWQLSIEDPAVAAAPGVGHDDCQMVAG